MRQIVSVRDRAGGARRILRQKTHAAVPTGFRPLTIFNGLVNGGGTSLQQTVNLSANDQHYRYRVFEFTVPLRNMLVLAGA